MTARIVDVLPPHLLRIRHVGFLANCTKTRQLAQCRRLLHAAPAPTRTTAQRMHALTWLDPFIYPHCHTGTMVTIDRLSPPIHAILIPLAQKRLLISFPGLNARAGRLSAMKTITISLLLVLGSAGLSLAQDDNSSRQEHTQYPFLVQDSPSGLFTMRQVDQDYLSGVRLFSKVTNDNLEPAFSYSIQAAACLLAFKTFPHEEAHRSILVGQEIGSVSHPFLLSERGGYVTGVTDNTLKNLRDARFPTFIRLHTAGFESDYMLATREETLLSLQDETYNNLFIDYLFRKAALIGYFTMGILKHDIDGPEEPDELQRDIVGNDFYGVIRHLHRPGMEFKRYTRYEDLTGEELHYMRRLESRTFLNLLNANLIGVRNFRITDTLSANAAMGHCMGPFGDFIDEKFWFVYKGTLKINAYMREFQNRENWFPGAGVGISRYPVTKRSEVSLNIHVWKQPLNLGFNEKEGKAGGAVDVGGSCNLLTKPKSQLKSLSLELGMIYKTAGFLPEEIVLDEHFGFRFGFGIGFGAR